MKTQQLLLDHQAKATILQETPGINSDQVQLVLVFGQRTLLEEVPSYTAICALYPNAFVVTCSSSGQISDRMNLESEIVVTAVQFEKTQLKSVVYDVLDGDSIQQLGEKVRQELAANDLKAILVLSEGTNVNGSELIQELEGQTHGKIPFFGGLAGDEFSFEKTIVGLNAEASPGKIVAVGFYGEAIEFGFASEGGWADFGPEREVTASDKNVLYKIGDRYALDLYKEYLGKYADELPGSALYFPLSMKETPESEPVVRTILSIDETQKSMTFAGNIPVGAHVRLMRGNLDRLVDAAEAAASQIRKTLPNQPQLAFLVSCVGRRIVLAERVLEELEVIKNTLGKETVLFGFYSYGEISPNKHKLGCELHNQTMTIATLFEV
ncbi:MAG: hypothetical protein RLZZ500_987 [Bacteroidota bacterium]|jgi:hypothetical protein